MDELAMRRLKKEITADVNAAILEVITQHPSGVTEKQIVEHLLKSLKLSLPELLIAMRIMDGTDPLAPLEVVNA